MLKTSTSFRFECIPVTVYFYSKLHSHSCYLETNVYTDRYSDYEGKSKTFSAERTYEILL